MRKSISIVFLLLLISIAHVPAVKAEEKPCTYARSVYLMDYGTGRVLYEKQAHVKMPMASTTKIMTALIVLEHAGLDETVTVSRKAASIDGSTMNLKAGDQYTVLELMYGLLLRSGNDAATALAEHVAGSVEAFCSMMNKKAKEIGANNTNFVTPHGLDNDNHYTTAYELALITWEALKNETFREIIATKSIVIRGQTLSNTNNLLYSNNGTDGVKTGFTAKAGRCIVITAERDGMRIIGVVLGCDTKNKRTSDCLKITEYAYSNYSLYDLFDVNTSFGDIKVIKGKTPHVNMVNLEKIRLPLTEKEYASLNYEVKYLPGYSHDIKRPVERNEKIGELIVKTGDNILFQYPLYSDSPCGRKNFTDYTKEIFFKWLYPCH